MIGFYKKINEYGAEHDINVNEIKSERELYNKYGAIKTETKTNSINIMNLCFSPVYEKDNMQIFNRVKQFIEEELKEKLCVDEMKTPCILENGKKLKVLQELFGLEQFICNDNYILPPASDFGIFQCFENKDFSEKELPVRIYEFANCFRIEDKTKQKNILTRPTCFHLPDIHCFMKVGIYQEALKHLEVYKDILNSLRIPYFISMRISEQEYSEQKEEIQGIAQNLCRDIIVNIVPTSIKYWETKFKYIYRDSQGEYVQLSTVQVDYKSSKIFNIRTEGKNAIILHSSIGSMERVLYAFLDK